MQRYAFAQGKQIKLKVIIIKYIFLLIPFQSFVYVSTAYCNPGRKYVDEEIYPTLPPVKWKHFLDCTLKIPDEYFNSLANYIKV